MPKKIIYWQIDEIEINLRDYYSIISIITC
jgi:hypothetical protein